MSHADAQVTVKILLSKPVGGDNFAVRVDDDAVVANLLLAVERIEELPRKRQDTAMVGQASTPIHWLTTLLHSLV